MAFGGGLPPSRQMIAHVHDLKSFGNHVQCRICPSSRPFRLFAAEGLDQDQKLAELAKADRQPALALTDTDNMFGALEFSDKMAGYGIQPIIGCELAVDFGDQDPSRAQCTGRRSRAGRAARNFFFFFMYMYFVQHIAMKPRKQVNRILELAKAASDEISNADTSAHRARLAVENQKGFANEPLPLGISVKDASGAETVTVAGLANDAELSLGTSLGAAGWLVPAHDLDKTFVAPVGTSSASWTRRLPYSRPVASFWIGKLFDMNGYIRNERDECPRSGHLK